MRSELGKLTLDKVFRVKTNCCFISYFFSVREGTSCILSLHLFLRKGSLWIPTSSIPSTKLQTSGESVAFVTKSKIYTFHLVSKSPCRCRWEKQKSFLKHNFLVFNSLHDLMVQMGITWKYSLAIIQVQFIIFNRKETFCSQISQIIFLYCVGKFG